jgi:SAM-dependent methyltransferase
MARTTPFDEHADLYEAWFDRHPLVFRSELEALRPLVPIRGRSVEIGVGSGRFALPLGIRCGVEPSRTMAALAARRGLALVRGVAESLPLADASQDLALMVTTICFVDDPPRALREAARILRTGGWLVLGLVDLASPLGRSYERRRQASPFYRSATFFTAEEVLGILDQTGFRAPRIRQTVFGEPGSLRAVQPAVPGHGEGGFVVIAAEWGTRGGAKTGDGTEGKRGR